MPCPLCHHPHPAPLDRHDTARRYFLCPQCQLAFMHPDDRLDRAAEHAHYLTHENDPNDPRYRAFLGRLADPLIELLPPGARGLDFGSGPGPTLSLMLAEAGHPTLNYDPFFAPDPAPLQQTYDFITCTETAEHFFEPRHEFDRLHAMLKPRGILAIMTGMLDGPKSFADWWYPRDPTHVCFYQQRTLHWLADHLHAQLTVPAPNVAFFRKSPSR